jgi:hypothetical protein
VVGNRDWNRIEVELGAPLATNREQGSQQPVSQGRNGANVSKTDSEAILKHIEEALQETTIGSEGALRRSAGKAGQCDSSC